MSPILSLKNVRKSYGTDLVLDSVTLDIFSGCLYMLTGASGIGKSTLMKIMAKLIEPDTGKVSLSVKAALMFQDNTLIPWLSTLDNILFILPKDSKERARYWLNRLELKENIYPSAMSGGMLRRLALARTLAADRELLLLDEPFAFLDETLIKKIILIISEMIKTGKGLILTGHQLPELIWEAVSDLIHIPMTKPIIVN